VGERDGHACRVSGPGHPLDLDRLGPRRRRAEVDRGRSLAVAIALLTPSASHEYACDEEQDSSPAEDAIRHGDEPRGIARTGTTWGAGAVRGVGLADRVATGSSARALLHAGAQAGGFPPRLRPAELDPRYDSTSRRTRSPRTKVAIA